MIEIIEKFVKYQSVIGAAVFINILVSLLISHYSKSRLQKEIESLKQHHAISQKTYQKLFDERVVLYNSISEYFEEYDSVMNTSYPHYDDPNGEHDLHNTAFFKLSEQLRKIVKSNPILISSELASRYAIVSEKQSPFLKRIYHLHSESTSGLHEIIDMKSASENDLSKLHAVVKKDIDKLRTVLSGQF